MDPVVIVWVAIAAVAGAFGLLLVVIVVTKGRRQMGDVRRRRRRKVLEPIVLKYGSAEQGTLLEALAEPPKTLDLDVLEWILLDQVQAVRGRVRTRFIQAFHDLGLVDRHVSRLQSRRAWMRADAAERLGQMRSPRAAEPLGRAMDDPVPEVRIRAARALGATGGQAAVSKMITALREPNRWSAMRIADILTGMGEEAVNDLIRDLPRLPDPSRLLVIDIFGRVRSLKTIPVLRELLDDANRNIRARAAHALGQIGDPGSTSQLVAALSDPDWPVRAMAAKALGRVPGTESVAGLCDALTDSQWWVRANAAEALKSKGDPGHEALVGVLDSDDTYAREQAVHMLEESGALDEAVEQLGSSDEKERGWAVSLVSRLVELGRTDLLRQMWADHEDPEVRRSLTELLGVSPEPAGGRAS